MANRGGFSLVEMVVAMVVLTVGMLAMASANGYVSRQIRASAWDTQRMMAREQVVEELQAGTFASMATGGPRTIGRFTLNWVVSSPNTNLRRVLVIATGPAYRPRRAITIVTDTFTVEIARP